jgi:hypothetical protein
MRNRLLLAFFAVIAFTTGCQKDISMADQDADPANSSLGKTAVLSSVTEMCDVLTFDKEAAQVGVTSATTENGVTVAISTNGINVASLLNSANPGQFSLDMGTPSHEYNGPGFPNEGNVSGSATNDVALGNLLILQRSGFNYPREADLSTAEWIDLTFPMPITATSIEVIDVELEETESAKVILYDAQGNQKGEFTETATGSNGVKTIALGNTPDITRIRLLIVGSLGFSDLKFCTTTGSSCTLTQGYWKNHVEAWPVSELMLGGRTYSQAELLSILNKSTAGNGLISMAHQLIAAKLNIANGSDPSAVATAIANADMMIGSLVIPPVGSGYLHPSTTSALNNQLDSYNRGLIGPGHCDEQ